MFTKVESFESHIYFVNGSLIVVETLFVRITHLFCKWLFDSRGDSFSF